MGTSVAGQRLRTSSRLLSHCPRMLFDQQLRCNPGWHSVFAVRHRYNTVLESRNCVAKQAIVRIDKQKVIVKESVPHTFQQNYLLLGAAAVYGSRRNSVFPKIFTGCLIFLALTKGGISDIVLVRDAGLSVPSWRAEPFSVFLGPESARRELF